MTDKTVPTDPKIEAAFRDRLRDFAHEIGNPLNAMIGYSQLARQELAGDADTKKLDGYIRTLEASTIRLLRICEHVLDDAINGEERIHADIVNAAELADEVISIYSEIARKRGIEMKSEFPADFPMIPSDPVLVSQILSNLVSNAVKFTPTGGTITLRGEVDSKNNAMLLLVRDTGRGIPANLMLKVRRGESVTEPGEHGDKSWGRGLQIALRLAKRLGGSLVFEPAGNGGTIVMLSLPLDRETNDHVMSE